MEPVNSTQMPGIGPVSRKRKSGGEFLTALNLLAETYSQSGKTRNSAERSGGSNTAYHNPRNSAEEGLS